MYTSHSKPLPIGKHIIAGAARHHPTPNTQPQCFTSFDWDLRSAQTPASRQADPYLQIHIITSTTKASLRRNPTHLAGAARHHSTPNASLRLMGSPLRSDTYLSAQLGTTQHLTPSKT